MDAYFLPLLLASDEVASSDETEPLDRLRMQKGVFLLQQRGPSHWRDLYRYEPYDWGPFSRDLARDVKQLEEQRLLDKVDVSLNRYPTYRSTRIASEKIATEFASHERDFARQVRRFVCTRSFTRLLKDVYAKYPQYAVNSRFQS